MNSLPSQHCVSCVASMFYNEWRLQERLQNLKLILWGCLSFSIRLILVSNLCWNKINKSIEFLLFFLILNDSIRTKIKTHLKCSTSTVTRPIVSWKVRLLFMNANSKPNHVLQRWNFRQSKIKTRVTNN